MSVADFAFWCSVLDGLLINFLAYRIGRLERRVGR